LLKASLTIKRPASQERTAGFCFLRVKCDTNTHGEEVQIDDGEGALTRVPETDRYRRPRLFVMTMRYSRRSFRRVVWESSQQVWARLHEQAWRYFGGSCSYVVLDNLKEGVIKPDLYEPELNSVYRDVPDGRDRRADPRRARPYPAAPLDPGRRRLCRLFTLGAQTSATFPASKEPLHYHEHEHD
jgi:hypothetical protein